MRCLAASTLVLAALIAGCGGNGSADSGANGGTSAAETPLPETSPCRDGNDVCNHAPVLTASVAALDGYTVVDQAREREIDVRVRFPIDADDPAPVVVFSHGGAPRPRGSFGNVAWGETLAAAGYVVVHVNHPLDIADRTRACAEIGLALDGCGVVPAMQWLRPGDAAAVLEDLDGIVAAFPELDGRVDTERVAMAATCPSSTPRPTRSSRSRPRDPAASASPPTRGEPSTARP